MDVGAHLLGETNGALADLLGPRRPVSPIELFEGDGTVSTPTGDIELALLRTVLSATPVKAPKPVVKAAEHWSRTARLSTSASVRRRNCREA